MIDMSDSGNVPGIGLRRMARALALTALVVLAAVPWTIGARAQAQVPPDRDGLLNGEGMGMAAYAEANGYPGPKHVLDLAEQLGLSAKQKADIKEIYDDMLTRARSTGKLIVKVEKELNDQFINGNPLEANVTDDAESIGKMRGSLRAIHLGAHVRTKALLTPKQVELYVKLRREQKEKGAAGDGKQGGH